MYLYVSVDALIRSFQNAERYAEAHNRGNEGAMFKKIVRDLDSIRDIPPEAFAGFWSPAQMEAPNPQAAAPQEPEATPQTRVNTTESLRSAQGPAQWPGNKPLSPPEPGDTTPPPKPFITPDLPPGTPGAMEQPEPELPMEPPSPSKPSISPEERERRKKELADKLRQQALDDQRAKSVDKPEVADDYAD